MSNSTNEQEFWYITAQVDDEAYGSGFSHMKLHSNMREVNERIEEHRSAQDKHDGSRSSWGYKSLIYFMVTPESIVEKILQDDDMLNPYPPS